MEKLYWQHPESCCIGWVESERALELILQQPCADHITFEQYSKLVDLGWEICEPTELWLLDPTDRTLAWNHILELKAKLDQLGTVVQNDGVCIKTQCDTMLGLKENLVDGINGYVDTVVRLCKPVK